LSDSFTHEKEYQPPQACVRDAANFVAAAATMGGTGLLGHMGSFIYAEYRCAKAGGDWGFESSK